MTSPAEAALTAYSSGLCVVPPREDGSKRPDGRWLDYQQARPPEAQVRQWYANGRHGLGLLCGAVSGGLEMLELEGRAVEEGLWKELCERAVATGLGPLLDRIVNGYSERTPGEGVHLLYRCAKVEGNRKLARRHATDAELAAEPQDRYKVLVETRGEGGFTIVAPSHGPVHPTGKPWVLLAGGFGSIAEITPDERDALHDLCRSLDRVDAGDEPQRPTGLDELWREFRSRNDGERWIDDVVDDYNATTTWADVLGGWHHTHSSAGVDYWTRPGKDPREGHSATTNAKGTDRLIVFSSSTPFDSEPHDGKMPSYDRFGAYAVLHHGGDRVEAAKRLRDAGYGPPRAPASATPALTPTVASTQPAADTEPPPVEIVELVEDELGVGGIDGLRLAAQIAERRVYEQIVTVARRLVRDDALARETDLNAIDVVTASALIVRERPKRRDVLGDLLLEGQNATVVARYKAGKSTLVENMARAAVTGGQFLARFAVPEPLRVVLMNYELDEDDMTSRVAGLSLDDDALERLLVVNLRGHRLPLMARLGVRWLAGTLAHHRADVVIVDPFGAAFAAAGGISENDNAEVRRFTTALDEIKRLSGCRTLVMPVHTGRGEQGNGDERGRGATVLDDWPDVRMLLTVDESGHRYLRTDGRARGLNESRLGFDEYDRRLMLASTDLGLSRKAARRAEAVETVVKLVREAPGINTRELRDALGAEGVGHNYDKDKAIADARSEHRIHMHTGPKRAVLHYAGEPHDEVESCPEGWVA